MESKGIESVKPIDEKYREYLLQEASIIGERIKWYLEQHERIETLGLFSTGAIWAFIMSQEWNSTLIFITWIPLLITIILFIKSHLFTKTIGEAFQYLYEIEEEYNLPKGKGWVHYFRQKSSRFKRRWRYSFWIFLTVINLVTPIFFPFKELLKTMEPAL